MKARGTTPLLSRAWRAFAASLTILAWCASARAQIPQTSTITLRSGNGTVGGRDSAVTLVPASPAAKPFTGAFTPTSFADARIGQSAIIVNPQSGWLAALAGDAQSQWIATNAFDGGTALYAISFTLASVPLAATLNLNQAVADELGGGRNGAVYVNGTLIPGISNPDGGPAQESAIFAPNIGSLLRVGANTLYIDATDTGGIAGLLFRAEVTLNPPAITESPAAYTEVGAILSGSANPLGQAVSAWFEWGTDTTYGNQTASQAIGSGTNYVAVTAPVTGLTVGDTYHCNLVYVTASGTSYGGDQSFVAINVPSYTVNNAEIAPPVVALSASVDPNGVAGPAINRADLYVSWQYGLTSGSYPKTTASQPIPTNATSPVQITLPITGGGALAAAIYHYRLLISSSLGDTYGPDQVFSVKPPTLAFAGPAATGTDVVLSVTVNPNGLDTTVSIQYGLTTGYTDGTISVGDIGSGFAPVAVAPELTGLAYNTEYHYRLVTTNALGTFYGPDQIFATEALFGTGPIASTKDTATEIAGAAFSAFGIPAINAVDHAAFQSTISGKPGISAANNSGIWAGSGANARVLVARTGTPAPGYGTAPGSTAGTFATLSDPVYADDDSVAFLGKLAVTGTVNNINNIGIWATTSGSLALAARTGDLAPDSTGTASAGGPVFASFSQFVLPDQGGVVILVTLTIGRGGVLSTNDHGIWAVGTDGILREIIRTGEALSVNGTPKIISAITIFNAPSASTGQSRHFNAPGDLLYKVGFTDGTTSIVQSALP
jgi:hypothetical protein